MEQLSITLLWVQIAAEAGVGLAQCAVVAYYLWKMQKYHQERSRILDEREAAQAEERRRWAESTRRLGQVLEESTRHRAEHQRRTPLPSN